MKGSVMYMFCSNCGKKIDEGARFCVNCGKKAISAPYPEISPEQEALSGGGMDISRSTVCAASDVTAKADIPEPARPATPAPEFAAPAPPPETGIVKQSGAMAEGPELAKVGAAVGRRAVTVALSALLSLCVCALAALLTVRSVSSDGAISVLTEKLLNVVRSCISEYNFNNDGFKIVADVGIRTSGAAADSAAEILSGYIAAFAEGNSDYRISSGDIARIIKDNAGIIAEKTGYGLKESDYPHIRSYIDDSGVLDEFSAGKIAEAMRIPPAIPHLLLSTASLLIAAISCLLLTVSIFLLNLRRCRDAFLGVGVSFCAAGLICAAGMLMAKPIIGAIGAAFSASAGSIAAAILTGAKSRIISLPLSILALGALSPAAYAVIRAARKTPSASSART
jgi:hypothetical protein